MEVVYDMFIGKVVSCRFVVMIKVDWIWRSLEKGSICLGEVLGL